MCGIAGVVDLLGHRAVLPPVLQRMALAIRHRGPDEDGFMFEPGLGLASRRLSIVGLKDGRQPIFNEDRTVAVVFNGELFNYVEKRHTLRQRGHQFPPLAIRRCWCICGESPAKRYFIISGASTASRYTTPLEGC